MRKLILLVSMMFVSLAAAQTADDLAKKNALQRFDEGVVLVDKGQYEEARLKFVQAYAVIQKPALLFNLAVTEQKTNRAPSAAGHFRKLLKDPTTPASLRTRAEKMMSEIAATLARVVVTAPDGADVSVDGAIVGRAPLEDPVDVTPGAHDFGIRLQDRHVELHRELKPGDEQRLELRFVETAPMSTVTATTTTPIAPPVVPASNWNGRRTAGVVVGSAGLLAGGLAIGFGVSAAGNADDRDTLKTGMSPSACFGVSSATCTAINDKAHAAADQSNIAIGLAVGGAALLVTGLVLVAVPLSHDAHARLWIRPSIGFLEVGGQW